MTLQQVIKCLNKLRFLSRTKNKSQRIKILKKCKVCIYKAIGEISKNILLKNIPLSKYSIRKLLPHKKYIRDLAYDNMDRKRYIIEQKGGFLPSLLIPAVAFLSQLISK